jgi:transcription termination factor NusB
MKARIVSRKIFVMSIYEQLVAQTNTISDIVSDRYDFPLYKDTSLVMTRMVYMAERFFTNWEKESADIYDMVDISFLKEMLIWWNTSVLAVIRAVQQHATTFSFERMDPIDKAIFLAWWVEYLVHKTPVKIILNEMVEIAKRYWDEWAPKLINGIWHKVIETLTM